MSGELVVVILVVALLVALIWHEVASDKPKGTSSDEEGSGRPIGTLLRWGLVAAAAVLVLGATGEGCDDDREPEEPGAPVERVTCGSYRAQDCPPVTPASQITPPTPNTAGIPEEIPA